VPGYPISPLRGWILKGFGPPFSQEFSSHAHSEARIDSMCLRGPFGKLRAGSEGPLFPGKVSTPSFSAAC